MVVARSLAVLRSVSYRFISAPLFLRSTEGTSNAAQLYITIKGSTDHSCIDHITCTSVVNIHGSMNRTI